MTTVKSRGGHVIQYGATLNESQLLNSAVHSDASLTAFPSSFPPLSSLLQPNVEQGHDRNYTTTNENATIMQPARALHRHQSSLEGIINFSEKPSLTAAEHVSASRRFHLLINKLDEDDNKTEYDRVKLVRLTYKYALSEESRINFLRAFFEIIQLPLDGDGTGDTDIDLGEEDQMNSFRESTFSFADYLFQNFFLPREFLPLHYTL